MASGHQPSPCVLRSLLLFYEGFREVVVDGREGDGGFGENGFWGEVTIHPNFAKEFRKPAFGSRVTDRD